MVIVLAKRMGLSFDELNEITMQNLLDIAGVYANSDEDKPKKRKANQADIVSFWGANPKKGKGSHT